MRLKKACITALALQLQAELQRSLHPRIEAASSDCGVLLKVTTTLEEFRTAPNVVKSSCAAPGKHALQENHDIPAR